MFPYLCSPYVRGALPQQTYPEDTGIRTIPEAGGKVIAPLLELL